MQLPSDGAVSKLITSELCRDTGLRPVPAMLENQSTLFAVPSTHGPEARVTIEFQARGAVTSIRKTPCPLAPGSNIAAMK
jgi:hypothetical protein